MAEVSELFYTCLLKKLYKITEVWRCSKQEIQIHSYTSHGAIDFELTREN